MGVMPDLLATRCLPLLARPRRLTAAVLGIGWRSVWGEDAGLTDVRATADGVACNVDGVACEVVAERASDSGLELRTAAAGSWLWPKAAADMTSCPMSAVVRAQHEPQPAGAVLAHAALGRLVAAVLPALASPGVFVEAAGMLVRADIWTGLCQQSPLPFLLWVHLDCLPEPAGTTTLATTGLGAFGLPELEVGGSSRECGPLREWGAELVAWYVLDQPALKDGDTVGLTGDRLLVRRAPSVLGRPEPVLRLVQL